MHCIEGPEHYPYDLNLADIAESWRRGSVIASWLLDLAAVALLDSPDLAKFASRVPDSGERHWTIMAAIDESVPASYQSLPNQEGNHESDPKTTRNGPEPVAR